MSRGPRPHRAHGWRPPGRARAPFTPSRAASQRAKPTASPFGGALGARSDSLSPASRRRAAAGVTEAVPTESTPHHRNGTMADTVTAAAELVHCRTRTLFQAASTPSIQACCGSCSNMVRNHGCRLPGDRGHAGSGCCGVYLTVRKRTATAVNRSLVPMSMPEPVGAGRYAPGPGPRRAHPWPPCMTLRRQRRRPRQCTGRSPESERMQVIDRLRVERKQVVVASQCGVAASQSMFAAARGPLRATASLFLRCTLTHVRSARAAGADASVGL